MAYTRLATNLYVTNVGVTTKDAIQHSAAIRLEGASYVTVQGELVNFKGTGTGPSPKVTITVEISDDGLNWRALASSGTGLRINAIDFVSGDAPAFVASSSITGSAPGTPATLTASFLRLQYETVGNDGNTAAFISAGVNVSRA